MKKITRIFAALALVVSAAACSPKAENFVTLDGTNTKDLLPSKSQTDSVSYLLGINFGSFITGYNFGKDINYSEVAKGIKDFVNAKGDQNAPEFVEQFKINPELMNDLFNSYLEKRANYTTAVNSAKETAFLVKNAQNEDVKSTESGLQYTIIEEGTGAKPGLMDTVVVRYKGTLINGTVFDQVREGQDPVELQLNRVIPGWQEGMQLIGEGGKIKLYIPSDLGYGASGSGSIEPYSTLIFDVELVAVHPYVEE